MNQPLPTKFISEISLQFCMDITMVQGAVVRGLGEGTYFMSMQHYRNEIKKKLGFNAYPGTLNLKLTKEQFNSLKKQLPIKIEGYKSKNKTFGAVNCCKARIKDINGAIIIPESTKHKNIIEFIAPVHIKSTLNLKDYDKVEIHLK